MPQRLTNIFKEKTAGIFSVISVVIF